jgi:hypothetical protein
LQGVDLFLVLFFAFVQGSQLGVRLLEESLTLNLEIVAAEPLELELEFECICQDLQLRFVLFDALLKGGDGSFLRLQGLEFLDRRFARAAMR